jgi:hypothetical protein
MRLASGLLLVGCGCAGEPSEKAVPDLVVEVVGTADLQFQADDWKYDEVTCSEELTFEVKAGTALHITGLSLVETLAAGEDEPDALRAMAAGTVTLSPLDPQSFPVKIAADGSRDLPFQLCSLAGSWSDQNFDGDSRDFDSEREQAVLLLRAAVEGYFVRDLVGFEDASAGEAYFEGTVGR